MTRPSNRRTMTIESLETREVLSATSVASQQYVLELINLTRTNPTAAADWIGKNVDAQTQATLEYYNVDLRSELSQIASARPQQPLAYNDRLAAAAHAQSEDQARNNYQGHNGSDGSDLGDRLDRAGYGDVLSNGENAFAYATSLDNAVDAFLIDWGVADKGHRRNILQPDVSGDESYSDVGVGIVATGGKPTPGRVGPYVVTMNFGSQKNDRAELLGVAFKDGNGDNFYSQGEGQGGVQVRAENLATGQVATTETTDAGGYQVSLLPGNYRVSGSKNGRLIRSQDVSVGTQNVKVDYDLSDPWATQEAEKPVVRVVAVPQVAAPKPQPVAIALKAEPVAVALKVESAPVVPVAPSHPVAPAVNPLSWITSWTAYRNGKRIG